MRSLWLAKEGEPQDDTWVVTGPSDWRLQASLTEKGALGHLSFAENLPDLRASASQAAGGDPSGPPGAAGTPAQVTSTNLGLRTDPAQTWGQQEARRPGRPGKSPSGTHRGNAEGPVILLRASLPHPP